MNKGEYRRKNPPKTVFTQGRDVFRTLSNTYDGVCSKNT